MKTVQWMSDNIKVSPSRTFGRMTFNVEMVGGKKPAKVNKCCYGFDVLLLALKLCVGGDVECVYV